MKTNWTHLEAYRVISGPMSSFPGQLSGAFRIPRGSWQLIAVADSGAPEMGVYWEHVSLRMSSYKTDRLPTWTEMCYAKDLFWEETECVVQYHPPKADYVNNHPFVLHLWKPTDQELPRPPSITVGVKDFRP